MSLHCYWYSTIVQRSLTFWQYKWFFFEPPKFVELGELGGERAMPIIPSFFLPAAIDATNAGQLSEGHSYQINLVFLLRATRANNDEWKTLHSDLCAAPSWGVLALVGSPCLRGAGASRDQTGPRGLAAVCLGMWKGGEAVCAAGVREGGHPVGEVGYLALRARLWRRALQGLRIRAWGEPLGEVEEAGARVLRRLGAGASGRGGRDLLAWEAAVLWGCPRRSARGWQQGAGRWARSCTGSCRCCLSSQLPRPPRRSAVDSCSLGGTDIQPERSDLDKVD